jgi:hypothetical protein
MSGRDNDPPGRADRSRTDADLDAVLAASHVRLAAAIRRGLDLDAGLARIIGEPPRPETPAGAGAERGPLERAPHLQAAGPLEVAGDWPREPDTSEVSCRIARLRFEILDLLRGGGCAPLCDTAAALCSGAAANLKDLNRGLEAHELTRPDAISLLDLADLALEKAHDTQKSARRHPGRTRAEGHPWASGEETAGAAHLHWMIGAPTWPAWLVIAVPALVASLTAAAVPLWAGRVLAAGPVAALVGIPLMSGLVFCVTLVAVPVTAARTMRRRAASREAGSQETGVTPRRGGRVARMADRAVPRLADQAVPRLAHRAAPRLAGLAALRTPPRAALQLPPRAGIRRLKDPATAVNALRGRLAALRPGVLRLFDEADGQQRPRCSPR